MSVFRRQAVPSAQKRPRGSSSLSRFTAHVHAAATSSPPLYSHTSPHTLKSTGPDRSIIKQSYDARERLQDPSLPNHLGFGNLNGDGFGIGWYAPDDLREGDPTPCMYKSITPAW